MVVADPLTELGHFDDNTFEVFRQIHAAPTAPNWQNRSFSICQFRAVRTAWNWQ